MLSKEQFKVARKDILGIGEDNVVFDNLLYAFMCMHIMKDCGTLKPDDCMQLVIGSDEKVLEQVRGVVEYVSICDLCAFLSNIARKPCETITTQLISFINNTGILPEGCSVKCCNCLVNSYV